MFKKLLEAVDLTIANAIFKAELKQSELSSQKVSLAHFGKSGKGGKPGRNDPCPCGKINPKTGKTMKYKRCHGK